MSKRNSKFNPEIGAETSTFQTRKDVFRPTSTTIVRRVVLGAMGFRNRYGHWPARVQTYQELVDALKTDLTERAFEALIERLKFDITGISDVLLLNETGSEQWSYGNNEIPLQQSTDDFTMWVWGIVFSQKPSADIHPCRNEGSAVRIATPSAPTPLDEFADPYMVATVVPGGTVPDELNGVAFAPWTDHPTTDEEWYDVEGQIELDEPPMIVPPNKKEASGVIIEEDDGRFWVVHPTNKFGGYETTFPKGVVEDEMPSQANAIKNALEETGLKVEITGYVGDVERSTSIARYYMARRVGGSPVGMGWETQAVSLVPRDEIVEFMRAKVDRDLIRSVLEKVVREPPEKTRHWSEDPYWRDALEAYYRLRDSGSTEIVLDLEAIEEILVRGDGPAFRLVDAMQSVVEYEGQDGHRGAPRLVMALLARLNEISQSTGKVKD